MIIEIAGQKVEVDDSFQKLSPEQQQATVNEIAQHVMAAQKQQQRQTVQTRENSTGETLGGTAAGIGGALVGGANQVINSPIGHAIEILGGGTYALRKLGQMADRFSSAINPNATRMQNGQVYRAGSPGANMPATGPAAPSQPTTFTNGANPAWDEALSKPHNPTKLARTAAQAEDMAANQSVRQIAMEGLQSGVQGVARAAGAVAPWLRGLGATALALHSEGLNPGEDQMVAQIHAQQDAQTGPYAPQPTPPGPVVPGI